MFLHQGKIIFFTTIIVFLCIGSIITGQARAEVTLKIGGTGTALGSMRLLSDAFRGAHPDTTVVVLPSLGSTGGIRAVLEGAIDIGLSARVLREGERSPELRMLEYSRTPFVPVVNTGVEAKGVNDEDLLKIYNGDRVTWPQGSRLRLVIRPAGETDTAILKNISPDLASAVDAALNRPGMLVALTDQENTDMIEKLSGAFGFSTLSQIISERRSLKILSYNGVSPSLRALSERRYPLFKPLFLVMRAGTSDPVRLFLEFLRSEKGRSILEKSGNLYVMDTPGR